MRHNAKYILPLLLTGLMVSTAIPELSAETRYVNDTLVITLREGPSTDYKVIRTMKTGTVLEVLEEEGEYIRIRTESGLEGWAAKQYTTAEIPKAQIIETLRKEVETLRQELQLQQERHLAESEGSAEQELRSAIANLREELKAKTAEAVQLGHDKATLAEKYETIISTSSDILQTAAERDELQVKLDSSTKELMNLRADNAKLTDNRNLYWFVAGAGVFLFGWLIGKSSGRKKKRSLTL